MSWSFDSLVRKHPLSPDEIELLLVLLVAGMSAGMFEGMLEGMSEEMSERSRRGESWQDVFQQKSRPGVAVVGSPRPVSEGLWADQALPLSGPLPLVPRAVSPP